jgi:EAL domain-containing protein (putative c-di-GMP-specific phosphodiesterase class I)
MFTGEVVGAEALIRWQHPENGLVAPGVFLPLIDEHPLAINIGEWVIHSALTQMESWQAAGLALDVSVNIGARQLQQIDFPQRLREILAAHPRIPPQRLELEVLETSALEDVARVSRTIHECRGIGVSFALDDFGTGYSSLTYLKRLPVTRLKIDQSFVRDMLDDTEDLAILDGVLSLAVAFGRDVIAEGVETVAQGTMLLQLGCTLGQGYGIARPMPGSDFLAWTSSWQVDALWTAQRVVKRVDLPLLFAGVEHRAWITGMELYLRGERAAPPPMDLLQCRFGHWIESEGRARYGSKPAFHRIEDLHRQVHAQAARQMELLARAEGAQALAQMAALFLLRDALLAEIALLLSESAASS